MTHFCQQKVYFAQANQFIKELKVNLQFLSYLHPAKLHLLLGRILFTLLNKLISTFPLFHTIFENKLLISTNSVYRYLNALSVKYHQIKIPVLMNNDASYQAGLSK